MEILAEKEAEDFLEKEGFEVVKRRFAESEEELKTILKVFTFPIVVKISSKQIIHKNKVGGVRTNVKSREEAVKVFREFEKIPEFEGVIVQEQISGKEFLLGLKKTEEFGHAVAFGAGGTETEKLKDVSFRIYPLSEKDALEMIFDVKSSKELGENEKEKIKTLILKLADLASSLQKIKELDINPLIVNEKNALIADARIVLE